MITRPPRPVVYLPQGMLGVDTTSDRQADVTQEAQWAGVVTCTWERRGGPGPRRVIGTRPQRTEARRPRSVPSRRGAGTHQQVGAAIISFRHCSRGAPSASAKRPQNPALLRGTHDNPSERARPAGCLYRPAAFPDRTREARSSLGKPRSRLSGPDQPLLSACLETQIKGEADHAGAKGAGTRNNQSAPR